MPSPSLEKRREPARAWRQRTREKLRKYAREYARKYRQRDPEKLRAYSRAFYERHAEERRADRRKYHQQHLEEERTKGRLYMRGYFQRQSPARRAEMLAYNRAYSQQHHAQVLARRRALTAANPGRGTIRWAKRRAKIQAAPQNDFTLAQWRQMKAHYKYRCVYCHRKMQRLTMDHITPISKGGSHTQSNIVPACQSCHSRKATGNVLKPVQPLLL